MKTLNIVAKTDRGRIRESNQDAYFVGELPDGTAFAVVCDGMGGAAGGNIASALAVQVISNKINASYHSKMRDGSIKNMLESALSAANIEVFDMAKEKPELRGMGTTVVCAVIKDEQAIIAHAGDSRAYVLNAQGLQQVTTDHSMVQDLLSNGRITADEARNHPNKNIITRAIGVDDEIEIDFDQIDFTDGEVLILCTDGLSNYVSDDEMIREITDGKYYAYADRLVQRANNNGGGDNITVVAIAN